MRSWQWGVMLAIFIMAFLFNNTYGDYSYPLHTDEYAHLAQATDIVEHKSIEMVNPYFQNRPYHLRLENGFHVFLAFFVALFKERTVLLYPYLRDAVFAINAVLVWLLAMRLSRSFFAGMFAALFFIFLKSNITILGNLFLVPLTFSLILVLLFFILFSDFPRHKIGLAVLYVLTLLIYPFASL